MGGGAGASAGMTQGSGGSRPLKIGNTYYGSAPIYVYPDNQEPVYNPFYKLFAYFFN
jgi:hypothetical protein